MKSSDENLDEECQPPTDMEEEGFADEEYDSGRKGSTSYSGGSGENTTQTGEENTSQSELGMTQIPLEEMLKGLIISQIRAPFVRVEEGLINLLKGCLMDQHPFFTSASLSGHVDHFQSVDDEDLGWGCGWRNIQILCSFLLAEDLEARDVLFSGAGFVPDIPALQIWLEIAWAKGFDKPGAEYFNWIISGTRKWIGTTECAALLRSFGVRAMIVSFTALGSKRLRGGLDTQKLVSPTMGLSDDDNQDNKSLESSIEGLKTCSLKLPASEESSLTQHSWNYFCDGCRKPIKGRRYKSLMTRNYDLCSNCTKEVDDNPTEERGPHQDYFIIEEHPTIRSSGPPEEDQRQEEESATVEEERAGIVHQEDKSEGVQEDASMGKGDFEEIQGKWRECGGNSVEEIVTGSKPDQKTGSVEACNGPKGRQSENAAGSKTLADEERGKAGMHGSSSRGDRDCSNVNHHHLIEWVWNYFKEAATQRFAANARNSRELVNMSKRSPLYFQHRGHSRTIVGIKRRREPASTSEDVYLLVLDPSVSTELLMKSLREKSEWEQLIEYDVHTLKETEYQLCYVDLGIAVGEELEQLKALSSLRYSYYSK
ncbi:unnamed protein product [Calypogeia fissa]